MPGSSSRAKVVQYVGVVAALVGVVGYTVFGWRFGGNESFAPTALGVLVAVFAVGWTVYQHV